MKREISNLRINNVANIGINEAIKLFSLDIAGSTESREILFLISKAKEISWDPITGSDYLVFSLIASSIKRSGLEINKVKLVSSNIESYDPTKFKYNLLINSTKQILDRFENCLKEHFNFN